MKTTARLYLCALCRCQVVICSDCDRGNIYCTSSCSQSARKASVKAASCRYQKTKAGRFNHAIRQRRYRQYKKMKSKIVTHQGSIEINTNDLLLSKANEVQNEQGEQVMQCHFCNKWCSAFLRNESLRLSEFKVASKWPRGP